MSTWSSGYNVDVDYTYGFYRELAPNWINYTALLNGVRSPSGECRILELGCGHGFGLILLAAIHPEHEFLGVDFAPEHVAHGRWLAAEAGLDNVRFEEADFMDLAQSWPNSWGAFDYVLGHGLLSWLNKSVRAALIKAIDSAAKPGSIVYLSYNTMPGSLSGQAVQHLFRLWQKAEATPSLQAIKKGTEQFEEMIKSGVAMVKALPALESRIESIKKADKNYLVHEYLHDNWNPFWFDEIYDELGPAKLSFIGSASVGDHYVDTFLKMNFNGVLSKHTDSIVYQVMVDVIVNQSFRRDLFGRGTTQALSPVRERQLRDTSFAIRRRPDSKDLKLELSAITVAGKPEIYNPLLKALKNSPRTIGDLMKVIPSSDNKFNETTQALTLLLQSDYVVLNTPASTSGPSIRLNKVIAKAVADGAPYRILIESKTGNVFTASNTDIIMMHEVTSNPAIKTDDALATRLVDKLLRAGKGLKHDDEPLTTKATMLPYAKTLAKDFITSTQQTWKSNGVF